MRTLIALAGLIAGVSSGRAQTLADFYSDAALDEIWLTMDPADWRSLQAHYLEDTYYSCDWKWRGITIRKAGVRSRGRTSRTGAKPALQLKFDEYVKGQSFLGTHKTKLKNSIRDGSYLRDPLSFKLMERMGLPYFRVAYTRLYINNVYEGLYEKFEEDDPAFLKRTFGESDGYLYEFKGEGKYRFNDLGPDSSLYTRLFHLENHKTDLEPSALMAMIQAVTHTRDEDFQSNMAKYLDWKQFLTYIGTEDFLAQNDGFLSRLSGGMANFDLYRPLETTVHVFFGNDEKNDMIWSERPFFFAAETNVLTRRALNVPELKKLWIQALLRAAEVTGGKGGWLDQEALRLYNQIREATLDGADKQFNGRFESGVAAVRKFIQQRGDAVRKMAAPSQ